jgi:hypothetical protein
MSPIKVIVFLSFALLAFGCGPSEPTAHERAAMIAALQNARKLDERNVTDPATDPAQASDSLTEAYKADRAIREIQNGYPVSRDEFADALVVPPGSISSQEKSELIAKLEKVKSDDQQIVMPIAGEGLREAKLRKHADEVDAVIKDLKIGEDVPWSRIRRALTPTDVE